MAGAPSDEPSGLPGSGPVLQLLASGLQLWIRRQCDAVGSLEIQLHGSALNLLRGRLEGVSLMARQVIYEGLEIELVQLQSDRLQIQIGGVLRGQPVQLEQAFRVHGLVAFTGAGLSSSLHRPQWQDLSDQLGDQLLGLKPLHRLRIDRDTLIVSAEAQGEPRLMELETRTEANLGTVVIRDLDGQLRARLPMDPNIRIDSATLEGGMLLLRGEARVSP
ncbi:MULTISPECIES: DUF2993 domain-containing protein [unclassified Synechococcus]|uniref:LmeA family phospholipid-binding protein n=1 Tax=Synechococcales TaxID=1890424 RepID=UPI001C8A4AAA|nr:MULTISPECIES: DUF2993 domain-containing protein [unclassified Synechococcus]